MPTDDDFDLDEAYYPKLLNVARSADLDLADNPGKDELVERLREAGVERTGFDSWEMDGEELELKPVQSNGESEEPTDTTILYCLSRESTGEHIDDLRNLLEGGGFELREAGSESDNYAIVLPAGEQDGEEDAGDE